jgi:hypothetical protein
MTAQCSDLLTYDGNKCPLLCTPLEDYFELGHIRPKSIIDNEGSTTANWRGYIGIWFIENEHLYLADILGPEGEPSTAMSDLFGEQKKPIEATWYSGVLRIPSGEEINYVHLEFETLFEKDILLTVERGKVINKEIRDYHTHHIDCLDHESLQYLFKAGKIQIRANQSIDADNRNFDETIVEKALENYKFYWDALSRKALLITLKQTDIENTSQNIDKNTSVGGLNIMEHSIFVEKYRNREIKVHIDRNRAGFFYQKKGFMPNHLRRQQSIVRLIAFSSLIGGAVLFFSVKWYFALAFFIFGMSFCYRAQQFAAKGVLEASLDNRDIYETALSNGVLTISNN